MQSLELAVLLGFSLLVVFAAVPYLWQMVSSNMAVMEARQVAAFLVALSDSLQSDFGLPGVQRSFYLPNLVYGSLAVDNATMVVRCSAGGGGSVKLGQLVVWYNSSLIIGGVSALRGPRNYSVANLGAPIAGVNASSLGYRDLSARGYVLFTGPVAALSSAGGTSQVAVVFAYSFRRVSFSGVSLTYRVINVTTADMNSALVLSCPGGLYTVEVYRGNRLIYSSQVKLAPTLRFVVTYAEVS